MTNIAINGFGRIGRLVFRLMQQRDDMQLEINADDADDDELDLLE